jgi:DNA mismatch repair protein MutS
LQTITINLKIVSNSSKKVKETPLMRQYNEIKVKHPDAMLLFRVGDFYETFGEDAILASKILGIVLTKRANGAAAHIELAGFPHHSLETYLPKLVNAGCRVAVCDQLEDPKKAKGIVKRGITELVTPGLSLNDTVLDAKKNNFLASVFVSKNKYGISFLDISTGEFSLTNCDFDQLEKLINIYDPAEILCSKKDKSFVLDKFNGRNIFSLDEWVFKMGYSYDKLISFFNVKNLKGYGVEDEKEGIVSAGAILFYLELTEHNDLSNITSLSRIEDDQYMWLDKFTVKNLELIFPSTEDSVTLKSVVDQTLTPMGSRLMSKWILNPLLDKKEIEFRQEFVSSFISDENVREYIVETMSEISDIERITSKIALNRASPRELIYLKNSLLSVEDLKLQLRNSDFKNFKSWAKDLPELTTVIKKIDKSLNDDASLLTGGKVIKTGYNKELDKLRSISDSGKNILLKIQNDEIEKTGISSLKIAYNKVFGYYLEVTNAHKDKVPSNWIRKQTLVNAERYITEELKEYEETILNADEKILVIERELFFDLMEDLSQDTPQLQKCSKSISFLDCVLSFSTLALSSNLHKPIISNNKKIDIKKGRHLIIEKTLPPDELYIPNDIFLDNSSQQIIIITGPNMSGKSAIIRQVALIVILAQIGSFVPAESSTIGIVDKIFTRVGASDNISKGESTFMVEMMETSSIMNNLTDRSLVLMDEIGRGTSTYDGISIAWSIVEYLHNQKNIHPKTLFATHYHELNQLEEKLDRVKNYNVSVEEINDEVIFLRKLLPGGSEHSFGINVAQLAGMPNQILIRAYEVLRELEKNTLKKTVKKTLKNESKQLKLKYSDPEFDKIKKIIEEININNINPVQALVKLNEIIDLLKSSKK